MSGTEPSAAPSVAPDPRQRPIPGLIVHQALHVGPLPPPAQLADYEAVHPGAAGWILDQSAKNAEHIRTMEKRGLEAQRLDMLLPRLLPFAVVLAFLIGSAFLGIFASAAWGAAGIGATLGAVLIAYLTGNVPKSAR